MANLLQVSSVSKAYSRQVLLNEASFSVGERKKIAVIGRNGAGKSTLFNIITGHEQADSGEVIIGSQTQLGYLKQEDDFQEDDTVLSYLMRESDREEWECAKIAAQFELKNEKLDALITSLSGGYQMRVKLSAMLLKEPNLILLDEPTNYLDLSTMLLLEKFLIDYRGSYLIISHDRKFIRNTCQEILEIERGKTIHFPNTLENYFEHKKKKLETEENFNKKQEKKKQHLQKFVDRFGAKASKASQAKSKAKQIAKMETIDIEKSLSNVRIKIQNTKQQKGFAWRLLDLVIGYGDKKVVEDIEIDIEKGSHVAILGDNGQGKSTFLKTLAEEINPISGTYKKAENIKVAYYAQHLTIGLKNEETVQQYLRQSADYNCPEEDIFKMASNFLFRDDDLKKPISVLSGGEKARLCIAGILLNNCDVLLLDEPTSHLDFETAEVLARSLAEANVTILFVSHDRTFINILATRILDVKDGTIKHFYGDFEDYVEHLENKSLNSEEKKSSTTETTKDKEQRKYLLEEKKRIKRELSKLEKQLASLKKEQELITQKILEDPKSFDPGLTKRSKEIETQIKKAEEDWMVESDKVQG